MGGRLQARGGHLSLRSRLILVAAGIVAVSLFLSGAITWALVRNLVQANARAGLVQTLLADSSLFASICL